MSFFRYLLLLFLGLLSVMEAKEVTLVQIMTQLQKEHPKYRAYEAQKRALKAKADAEYGSEPASFGAGMTHAKEDGGASGKEYSLSLGVPVDLFGSRRLMMASGMLETEAQLLRQKRELIAFENDIRNLYHQSCLNQRVAYLHGQRLEDLEKLYRKKRLAFKYHEISKKELLQLELERNLMRQRAKAMVEKAKETKRALLRLVGTNDTTTLSCRDLFPITEKITFPQRPFLLTREAFGDEIEAARKRTTRYSKAIEPITLDAGYDDEIDTKRYGIGFSMPLGFTSAKKERNRAYNLALQEQLKAELQNRLMHKEAQRARLEAQLKSRYLQIVAYRENSERYEKILMPLIEKSFTMGESSLLEYLLGREKLFGIATALVESEKAYYDTLFSLYTLTETEKREK